MTWTNATTTDGEWHSLSLVIDTDTHAGNIDREMLAACTGLKTAFATQASMRIAAAYDGPDLDDLVSSIVWDPGDDGIERTCVTVYPTPGHPRGTVCMSVRIPLAREPDADVLDGIKRRAFAFAASGMVSPDGCVDVRPFRVTGFRLIRERITTQSRDV